MIRLKVETPHLLPAALAIATLAMFFLLARVGPATAFLDIANSVNTRLYHAYDGLVCYDCHTIHNSEDGAQVANNGSSGPYARLLNQATVTDVCLGCHAWPYANVFKAPAVMSLTGPLPSGKSHPGGDFYYSMIDPKKGHNPGKSLGVQSPIMPSDPTLTVSPGGDFSTEDWDCNSCHDPHNMFGAGVTAWRKLRREVNNIVHTGNETASLGVETDGGNKGPTAPGFEPILSNARGDIQGTAYRKIRQDGNPLEGSYLYLAEGDTNKNVYRGGFSSFCATCHGDFHGGAGETRNVDNSRTRVNNSWVRHPTNITMNEAGSKYGIATYTVQITNAQGTSPNPKGYDWKYPLVQPDNDFTVKSRVTSMNDPATALGGDRIMCLTCHKAHASQYENMTRWNTNGHAFLADGEIDMTGAASNGDNPAYGCGKCHQKGGTAAFVKVF